MKKESENSVSKSTEILVVEDSITQATQIKHLLESHHYRVVVANDGKEAISKLSKHKPSLVISDIVMPEMNGYELCKKIKSNKNTEDIPVILLTILTDPEEIIEGLSCGADCFITKPFYEDHLLSNIAKFISVENRANQKKVPFGVQLFYKGEKRIIQAEQQNVIMLMLDIYEAAIHQNKMLIQTQEELRSLNERLESIVEKRTSDLTEEIKLSNEIANKLKESEEKFRTAMENSADAIFMTDLQGKYLYTNKAVTTMLGFTSEEMISMTIFDLSPQDKRDEYFEIFKQVLSKGKVFTEIELLKKDGNFISTDLNSVLLPGGLIYGSCRDISVRKHAKEELIKAKDKAEESDRLKSAFLANMSHEIRTPMNGILGFTDLLLKPDLSSEERARFIKIVHQSGQRMLSTVNDIVEISKIEAGLINVIEKETDLNERVKELIRFFRIEAEKKGLNLILEKLLPVENKKLMTDQNKLDSILTNLIKNAIKYTDTGTINVGCSQKGMEVEFYVKDTGIGIPKNRHKAVFKRFEQADIGDKRAFQGSGLGLAISKSYVEILDGKIWVESEEGKGSTFYFTLPYITEPIKETADQQLETSNKTDPARKLKILIAEDDEVSELLLKEELITVGKEILIAKTGVDAVKTCKNNPDINLVLMDIQMPGMNGYEATRKIREFNKEVVIIAQTAYGLSGDREKAIEAGCNDYISKPISIAELLALIQKYFG
ncbi:MAG: response regulator [Bacteroidales bacterium]